MRRRGVVVPAAARLGRLLAVLAGCGAVVQCGDGTGPADSALERLVGTWSATTIVIANELDPALTVDAFALGVRWEMTVTPDSLAIIDVSNPLGTDRIGGRVRIEGDSLFVEDLEDPAVMLAMHFSLTGDHVLQLASSGFEQCGSYGWEADECPIPTTIRITASRVETARVIRAGSKARVENDGLILGRAET